MVKKIHITLILFNMKFWRLVLATIKVEAFNYMFITIIA